MKKQLLIFCMLLFCTVTHAQQRLVGTFAYYPHATTPEKDSSRILYREGNTTTGSERDYTAGRLLYDTIIHYRDEGGGYTPFNTSWRHYNADTLIDTAWTIVSTATIQENTKEVMEYDATKQIISNTQLAWNVVSNTYEPFYRTLYTYAAGKLQQTLWQLYDTPGWINDMRTRNVYGTLGIDSVLTEVWNTATGNWTLLNAQQYVYSTSTNADTVRYINSGDTVYTQIAYTYTSTGKMVSASNLDKINGAFVANTVSLYSYNSSNMIDTFRTYSPRSATGDTVRNMTVYHYNTAKLYDSIVSYYFDVIQHKPAPSTRMVYLYNGAGWLTMNTHDIWDSIAAQWGDTFNYIKYHYEDVPVVGIPGKQESGTQVSLYPNPAGDILQMDIATFNTRPFTITIHDGMGRQLRQWQEKSSTTHTIPISDLQPGTYILTISNGSEKQSQQFVVAR
jgi:hypothetical protein